MLGVAGKSLVRCWAVPWLALGCGGATEAGRPLAEPIFVAVGADGTILSSPDAEEWSLEESGSANDLQSVAASDHLFVAVGTGGTILSSLNGRAWAARRSGTDQTLEQVTFDGHQFVAVGGGWADQAVALTSSDGVTWERVEAPPQYSFQAVATARGTILAAAVTPSRELPMALDRVVLASVLPSTSNRGGWIASDVSSFNDSVTLADETVVVGSWDGASTISRSPDGERWQSDALPLPDAQAIAAGQGGLVVVGSDSALFSADGEDWSQTSLPVPRGDWLMAVSHGAATFASVGLGGSIFVSRDGRDWSPQRAGTSTNLLDVTFGPTAP